MHVGQHTEEKKKMQITLPGYRSIGYTNIESGIS